MPIWLDCGTFEKSYKQNYILLRILILLLSILSFNLIAQTDCDSHRQNIISLSEGDRLLLNQLIIDYLVSEVNPDYDPNSSNFLNRVIESKYTIIAEHTQFGDIVQTAINHSNEEFLSWHREYIAGLEQYLLDQGFPQFVPISYWSPNEAIPAEFYNQFVPDYYDGLDLPTNPNGEPGSALYISDEDMTWTGTISIDDLLCEDFQNADDLGNALLNDAIHTSVHFEMGGAMSSQNATSGATAFWILHANLDRFYRCYQIECQCPDLVVTSFVDDCDYCFDTSESVNADQFEVILVDELGNESEISLNSAGCIPYQHLVQGDSYTAEVRAINSEMKENIECPNGSTSISFVAPNPPGNKFDPNPCLKIVSEPHFYTTTSISGRKEVTITNIGDGRRFDFLNSTVNTGNTSTLMGNVWLDSGESIEVEIPEDVIGPGSNFFITQVGSESTSFQYIISN